MRFTVAGRTIPHRDITPVCRGPTVHAIAAADLAAALGVPHDDVDALRAWCDVNKATHVMRLPGQSHEDAAREALERGFLTMVVR